MSFQTIMYEKDNDGVAIVTLNRPDVLNAYNVAMRDDLYQVFSAIRDDEDVRVMLLRGAGRAFCAGADLTEFGTSPSPTAARRIRFARDVWTLLLDLDVPSVVALHGFVFGSGLELALMCDLRVAAEGTQFSLPEVRLGMIPAAGATQTLSRVCGEGRALDLLLTGRRVEADEALGIGLITSVVAAERLQEDSERMARRLAGLDRRAVSAIRRAVREGADMPMAQGLRLEARLAASLRSGPDDS